MITVFAVVLLTAECLAAQAVPVCSAVTVDDAKTLLGPSAKRTNDPSGCAWVVTGSQKQLNVVRIGVASMFERAPRRQRRKREGGDREWSGWSSLLHHSIG